MSDDSPRVIECRGDPRAMGLQQGRALRASIRDRLAEAGVVPPRRAAYGLPPFVSGPVLGAGMGREIVRHYPHLSERIQGLAAGAGVSVSLLMELFVRAAQSELPGDPMCAPAKVVVRCEVGASSLVRGLSHGPGSGSRWLVRRSVPDVGFASVELTLPWLATASAGVNEAGMAAALAPRRPDVLSEEPQVADSPSSALLVQECLQRFDSLEGCVDWALKRPSSGNACLVVADSRGAAAAVEVAGSEKRVVRVRDGVLVGGGHGVKHAELREGASSVESLELEVEGGGWFVCVEPVLRELKLRTNPAASALTFPVACG
jgi:hypothetical protein